ncbi:MAG: AAA family ATPase [Bacteroidales bacterium]
MIISKIKLVNWKNFKNIEVELSERNFIVGANASGKSNFLDVIRFLRDIVKQAGGLQYAVEQRGGVSKIRCLRDAKYPEYQ